MVANEKSEIYCLTLKAKIQTTRVDWLWLRSIQICGPPAIEGLKARFWHAVPRAVVGHYLFASRTSLNQFRQHLMRNISENERQLSQLLLKTDIEQQIRKIPYKNNGEVFSRPIFILSAPRAGSTLLYEILENVQNLYSLNAEAQPIFDAIPHLNIKNRSYQSQVLSEMDADADTAAIFRSCLLAQLSSPFGKNTNDIGNFPIKIRLLEKTTENALRIPFLKSIFPDAFYIYLYRDLRQNVSSIIEAWQQPSFTAFPNLPGWADKKWSFLLPDSWQNYNGKALCQVAAFQWGAANQAIIEGLETLPKHQWTSISYTNLIAHPEQEIRRLCQVAELEPSETLNDMLKKPLTLSSTTLTPPSPIKWKSNPDFDPETVKYLQPLAGRMRSLEGNKALLVYRSHHQTKVRYACFADELKASPYRGKLIANPTLMIQLGNSVPLQLVRKTKYRERFLKDHPVLWWQDQASQIWIPIWLRIQQAWLCQQLVAKQIPPQTLTGDLHDKLHASGVLTTPNELRLRLQHGNKMIEEGRLLLNRELFCKLSNCIPKVLCAALSRYYNQLIDSSDWPVGDAQVELRHGWHNEGIARFIHNQLTNLVSKVAGRALKPTYSYSSAYLGGATLDAHMDREQCDYTLSLMVDEHIPESGTPWPLWFQTNSGRQSLVLQSSDAVLFRGCYLPHWREQASSQHRQINLLFHFVPAEWAGVMD